MRRKDVLGRYGEEVASRHLTAAGLVILDRNWRCSGGELDIVATDGPTLVFLEVKTRSSVTFGTPAEAVTPIKAARIRQLALRWLAENRPESQYWPQLRFDVISVLRRGNSQPPIVDHLIEAF